MFNVLKGYTFTEGIKIQRFLEGEISNRGLLHKVTFLRFKQCLQRALLYGIGQCPPSIHTELVDNFLAEKSLIKLLTN